MENLMHISLNYSYCRMNNCLALKLSFQTIFLNRCQQFYCEERNVTPLIHVYIKISRDRKRFRWQIWIFGNLLATLEHYCSILRAQSGQASLPMLKPTSLSLPGAQPAIFLKDRIVQVLKTIVSGKLESSISSHTISKLRLSG